MSIDAKNLPDDPTELRAMIAALRVENAKIAATLRVHDQLVQALRLQIAKLQKLAFGKSLEKIERKIEQLELALEDLLVAVTEEDNAPIDEGPSESSPEESSSPALRRRPRVSDATLRERRELDPGTCCPDCGGDLRVVGEDEGDPGRPHQEVLPPLRKDGAGARTQPSNSGQHGRAEPAGPYLSVKVRRSPSSLSPARDFCAYGGRHSRKHAGRLVRPRHENPVAAD
jgi:hypothetical protein